jgi:tRNA nucleotidyltransferase/poly(A) polymerase
MYLVGGAVRDAVAAARAAGADPRDPARFRLYIEGEAGAGFESESDTERDYVVCGLPQDELASELSKLGKCDLVGKSFGVLKFSPDADCEFLGWKFRARARCDIALPRSERSTGEHHRDFAVTFDPSLPIEADLMRRDFTINAMAASPDGGLVDPSGGAADLEAKILRTVFPRSFADDPLRILRAAQFAARFEMELDQKMVEESEHVPLEHISAERIRDELLKGLKLSPRPSMFFRHLERMRKLADAFPELAAKWDSLPGFYDALDRCPPRLRADALFYFLDSDSAVFPGSGKGEPASAARVLFNRLRFSNDEVIRASELSAGARIFSMTAQSVDGGGASSRPVVRRALKRAIQGGIAPAELLEFCGCVTPDAFAKIGGLWQSEVPAARDYVSAPPITGKRLLEMGYETGPLIGRILEAVSEAHDRGEIASAIEAEAFVAENYPK